MKHVHQRKGCRLEDFVLAAYNAAREATSDPLVATIIVTKIMEDWFKRSGRLDLFARLKSAFV